MKTTPEAWPILGRHSTSMLIGGSRPSFSGSPKKPSKDLTGSYITRPKQTKIAPKVFYTWKNRFDGQNLRLLESKSKAPIRKRRRAIASEEESRIVALRKQHIRCAKMKLERLYKNIYGTTISSWKIQYTIHKYKLYYHPKKNEKLQAKRERSQKKKRIT